MTNRLYLTKDEVMRILQATSGSRYALRDYCMILMGYLHGLRVSELTGIHISDIDFEGKRIFIRRLKNGLNTVHPIHADELKVLKQWFDIRSTYTDKNSGLLFITISGEKISRQRVAAMLKRYGRIAQLCIPVHPHMLRHACGYELAEQGLDTRLIQDYLGHRNIRHTVHYTAGNAARFSVAWKAMDKI